MMKVNRQSLKRGVMWVFVWSTKCLLTCTQAASLSKSGWTALTPSAASLWTSSKSFEELAMSPMFDLLCELRSRRLAMYLGTVSIVKLGDFLRGYDYAIEKLGHG